MVCITNTLKIGFFYLDIEDGGDLYSAQAALDALPRQDGRGAVVMITAPTVSISQTLRVPDRITLVGSGERGTIIYATGSGTMFEFDGITHAGLRNMRLGLNESLDAIAIDVKTTTGSCRQLEFSDLEIAGADKAGQIGIRATASNSQIISECSFHRLTFVMVDRPVVERNSEGNFWSQISVDQFARAGVARAAFDCVSLASFYQARVAGTVTNGSIGFAQGGARNHITLVADIGPNCTALDVTGSSNIIAVERPEALTPLGSTAMTNTIIDGEATILHRCAIRGSMPLASNFALTGFGSQATVTDISGNDQRLKFVVNAAGAGQAPNPTIAYWFADGPWPTTTPIVQVTRDGGNQNSANPVGASGASDRWGFTFGATPVAGESYAFIVTVG